MGLQEHISKEQKRYREDEAERQRRYWEEVKLLRARYTGEHPEHDYGEARYCEVCEELENQRKNSQRVVTILDIGFDPKLHNMV